MKLVEEFTFTLAAANPTPIGEGPFGNRIVHQIDEGSVEGERISGKLQSACDWSLVGPDDFLRIDARGQIETRDGAFLYIQYRGFLELSEKLRQALADGADTRFEDQDCYIHVQIESGSAQYSWVNTTFFVGRGRALAGGKVEYQIYRPA